MGAVADLTSQTQGKVEIIFYAQKMPAALASLGADARVSGDMINAILPEEHQDEGTMEPEPVSGARARRE